MPAHVITSEQQRDRMLHTPIPRLILSLCLPTLATQLISVFYNTADTYFVSKLSTSASAAVGVVFSLMSIIQAFGFGIGMETIDKWGPWMDLVSIYIIPIGATLGAISWFYVMKKDELLDAVNTGSGKLRGNLWYSVGRYVYVPLAVILCCVALFMHVAF